MILDEIIKKTVENLKLKKIKFPISKFENDFLNLDFKIRDIKSILKSKNTELNIIAEIKKASPSKGIIRENFDPVGLALEYERAGASAFSVLSEPFYFKGSLEYIKDIRIATKTPILRKDFIVDIYQISEAKYYGADFILLIAKALSKNELKALFDYTLNLGLEALVEVHDEEDLEKTLSINANIIGINNRNLQDFTINMQTSFRLIEKIPKDKIIVVESGLKSNKQLVELNQAGADAFLIGEHFMRQDNVFKALMDIKGKS